MVFVFSDESYVQKYDFIFDLLIRWFHEYFESMKLNVVIYIQKIHEKIIASKLVTLFDELISCFALHFKTLEFWKTREIMGMTRSKRNGRFMIYPLDQLKPKTKTKNQIFC